MAPLKQVLEPDTDEKVFGLSESQIARRIKAIARAAGLADWEFFSGHSGRVGMARRMAQNGAPPTRSNARAAGNRAAAWSAATPAANPRARPSGTYDLADMRTCKAGALTFVNFHRHRPRLSRSLTTWGAERLDKYRVVICQSITSCWPPHVYDVATAAPDFHLRREREGHTATAGTGVPVHRLGGETVAANYADSYDGGWEGQPTGEDGRPVTSRGNPYIRAWTGAMGNGTKDPTLFVGQSGGQRAPRRHASSGVRLRPLQQGGATPLVNQVVY